MAVSQQQANKIAGRLYDIDLPGIKVIVVSDRAAHALAETVGDKVISDGDLWKIAKASDYFIDFEDGEFAID